MMGVLNTGGCDREGVENLEEDGRREVEYKLAG
jgi:hypothetical protein